MNAFRSQMAILVHERDPYWTPELQRQLANAPIAIRRCERVSELDAVRANYASAVIVIEWRHDAPAIMKWLMDRVAVRPADPLIVLADEAFADWEWTLRGLGVTSFLTQPPSGRDLSRLCRTLLAATDTQAKSRAHCT